MICNERKERKRKEKEKENEETRLMAAEKRDIVKRRKKRRLFNISEEEGKG